MNTRFFNACVYVGVAVALCTSIGCRHRKSADEIAASYVSPYTVSASSSSNTVVRPPYISDDATAHAICARGENGTITALETQYLFQYISVQHAKASQLRSQAASVSAEFRQREEAYYASSNTFFLARRPNRSAAQNKIDSYSEQADACDMIADQLESWLRYMRANNRIQ